MFNFSIIFAVLAVAALVVSFLIKGEIYKFYRRWIRMGAGGLFALALLCAGIATFAPVRASHAGVVTTYGRVSPVTLPEGLNFVAPWQRVNQVYLGMDVAAALKSQAGSKDLQSVHSDITINFHVDATKAREMYQLNPSLNYKTTFVTPAMYEVFKAVIAQYDAEQIVKQRQEVSGRIVQELNKRLAQYHISVQTVNLVDFGFSKSFDAAIEEKVTATQKAATAERNRDRAKFEGESRIIQAEAEAKAITIQAAAIEKQGGEKYVQLQAISKWDGKLPSTMAGGVTPFLQVK